MTPAATASPTNAAIVNTSVAATCQLTKPGQLFTPPDTYPAPAWPPESQNYEWYGDARLWTMLKRGGDIWNGLPRGTDGFVQKTFWWSADFDVNKVTQPAITVPGQQLDGPGRLVTPGPGTNASADFGSAMLTLVDIPTARLLAVYGNLQEREPVVRRVGGRLGRLFAASPRP